MGQTANRKSRPTVFVHDFIPVDLNFDLTTMALSSVLTTEYLAASVARACNNETAGGGAAEFSTRLLGPADVSVVLGPTRAREDAVVIPIHWFHEDDHIGVPLEADLEVAAYGEHRSHLHLLGRARLRPNMRPGTRQASLFGRLAVAVVRHVLDDLAGGVAAGISLSDYPTAAASKAVVVDDPDDGPERTSR